MEKKLPIGIDDYAEIVDGNYYYVDKTLWIKELLEYRGKVNLFTRPRRFGKTLNISMLRYFFEDTGDEKINRGNRALFTDKKIMSGGEECLSVMNSYPVIEITMKAGKQETWDEAYYALKEVIADEYKRHQGIPDRLLSEDDKEKFFRLSSMLAAKEEYNTSLQFLSRCLYEVTGKKCIILIDEYDVPLESAYYSGYYDQMLGFLRSLFESALKTNSSLDFAVITGCLRISKESIFTGLNNLDVNGMIDAKYDEFFGFLETEVKELLQYYGFSAQFAEAKDWYDGYRFGSAEVYNPWSIIKYVDLLMHETTPLARSFWGNTSSNSIVRELVEAAGEVQRHQIEELLSGGSIEVMLHEETTYADIMDSPDNLWNFLLFTGYLKILELYRKEGGVFLYMRLSIPNQEVRYIYETTVKLWFGRQLEKKDYSSLYEAIVSEETEKIENEISRALFETISYFDYSAEGFYHGFLLGILSAIPEYRLSSNRETGAGRYDIVLRPDRIRKSAVVFELKYARDSKEIEEKLEEAGKQIRECKYAEGLRAEGYRDVICYAVTFFKKECFVKTVKYGE